ncbi:MAG: hypothetical protein JW716_03020 [Candidatus Aenigmarchaeota archaeon]|nr:hypothetical protein [Candidatus Aenigmarchaeota archaeon]
MFDISQIAEEDEIKVAFSEEDEETSNGYETKKKEIYAKEDEEEIRYIESDVPTSEDNDETHFDHSEKLKTTGYSIEMVHENPDTEFLFYDLQIENPTCLTEKRLIETPPENELLDYERDITVVKYTEPVIMEDSHGQYVFQQIEMKSPEKTNAYEMTMKAEKELGIKSEFSKEFGSFYVNEINGIRDGENGMWWEFYIRKPDGTVNISKDPIDKVSLDSGESIEWRLASEEPGGCGGGSNPGSDYIKDAYRGKSTTLMKQNYLFNNNMNPQFLLYN